MKTCPLQGVNKGSNSGSYFIMAARSIFFTTFFLALATYIVMAAEDSAEEAVKEEKWVDKKFDEHGVPVCVKPKPCKGRECKTPCHNGKCHVDGNCVCDDCWEGETCNAYNQSQECSDKLERSVPEEDRHHDEDEHDMGDNPYAEDDESKIPKKRRKRSGKKRVKRAASDPYPSSLTAKLTKTGDSASKTEGRTGQKMTYKVELSFPKSPKQELLVEIFTPDNTSLIMQLCDVRITHQGNLITKDDGTKLSDLPIVYDARVGVYPFDRAIINMGNLSCADGATTAAEAKRIEVHIEFDAVMINCKENDKTYWVSAGAEYNNENEIWVGQASFKTKNCPATDLIDTTNKPAFTIKNTYSSGLNVGESGEILLEMKIPHYQVQVAIDAIAPLEKCGIMSICGVLVYDSGESYKCVPKNIFQYISFKDNCGKCNGRARLDLGNVTNALKRQGAGWTYGTNDTITIAVYVQFDKTKADTNTDYWLGMAVEVGDKTIWTGQTKLRPKVFDKALATDSSPKVSLVANSSESAPVGGAIGFLLEITTEEKKTSDFSVECLMPFDSTSKTARMHVCSVEVCANGWNIPCVVPEEPEYSSRANPKDSNMDRVLFKLGHVTNHGVLAKNESASTISVCLYATVLPHAQNTPNAKMWVTCGLSVGDTKLWVGSKEITVIADPPFDATKAPKMELKYGFPAIGTSLAVGDYYTNSLADVRFEVTLKGQFKYEPMDIEMMMPYETDAPVLSICHVEILYAGQNLPCFNRAEKNQTFKLLTKNANNLTAPDRATNTLGGIFCINNGNDKNETHDKVVIRTIVKVEDHPTTKTTPKAFVSAGIQYHEKAIYVAQLALQRKDIANAPLTPEQALLMVVHLKTTDNKNTINQGESKSLLLVVKFPPLSTSDYEVVVEVDKDMASVCQVANKSLGHNMKCTKLDGDPTYEKWTSGDKGNKKATFKLGRITNPGGEKLNGTEPEKSAIVFDVAVKVSDKTTAGDKIKITAKVTYYEGTTQKDKLATAVELTVGAAAAFKTENGTTPDFKLARAPMLDNDTTPVPATVVPGQHFRCFMDITLKPGPCVKLTTKFMGPLGKDGVLDITDIRVWGIGKSMPCSSLNSGPPEEITKRTGQKSKDVGSLNMGQVCSFAKDGSLAEYRTIRVEVIGRIRIDNTVKAGESFWFSSVMKINEDQIYVSQVKMQMAAISTFVDVENPNVSANASMYFETGTALLSKKIHETFTLPVVVMVPVNSTCKANMDVKLEMDDTATMTLKEVKIVSSGTNMKGMVDADNPDEYDITYTSSQGTTQKDKATIGPFIVTNSGVTDRRGTADQADSSKDNAFTVELTIQMADAQKNADKAEVWASVGAKICKFIMIADKKITVEQEATNVPVLDATATLDKTTMNKGEKLKVSGTMKHDETNSKAECQNAHLKFFIPGFMYYSGGFVSTLTTTDVNSTENYFTIKWKQFLFTDYTTFSFELEIKSDGTLPTDADSGKVTIPYEPGCDMHNRTGNEASLDFIPSEMKSVSLILTKMKGPPKRPLVQQKVTPWLAQVVFLLQPTSLADCFIMFSIDHYSVTPGAGSEACVPIDLDLNNKASIKDCQLSCSAESDKDFPNCIRKSSTTGCKFPMRKGAEKERYVQFFFWENTIISGITFYKPPSATCEVTKFIVKYSNDLMGWVEGRENIVTAYEAGGAETTVSDGESGVAKAVRVYLTEDNCNTSAKVLTIKMDLKGCADSANKPADRSDPCIYKPLSWQTKDSTADTTYGHRGFVVGDTSTYFCDANPANKLQMNCFSSSETGGTSATKRMSSMAAHITGYYPKYGELYAIAQNGKSYIMSEDGGSSWVTITKDRWDKCANDATCAKAQHVPWDAKTSSPPSYKQSMWGGSASGLWVQKGAKWEQVTDWTTCCT